MNVDIDHFRDVLNTLKRRLHQREIQAVSYGISADPVINIEIEDLRKEIRSIDWKIARLSEDRFAARSEYVRDIAASIPIEGSIDTYKFDLTGEWKLEEIYEFGRTTGEANLSQNGNYVSGIVTIQDAMDDGDEIILQQDIVGKVREATVFLYGTHIQALRGVMEDYELDHWIGIIKNDNLIEGNSEDMDSTTGKFVMRRVLKK